MSFHLSSPARAATKQREGKPETVIEVESDGIRERNPGEIVHISDEAGQPCKVCGIAGWTWTDSPELHARHPARCSS